MFQIMNIKEDIFLSPSSKLPICIVPHGVPIQVIKPIFVEELLKLESKGMIIPNKITSANEYYEVRVGFIVGDSGALNNFVGIRSFSALHGCRACWISRKDLHDITKQERVKTATQIIDLHSIFFKPSRTQGTKESGKAALKEFSIPDDFLSPILLLKGDMCLQSVNDLLHAEKLGLLKREIIHILEKQLTKTEVHQVQKIINSLSIPHGHISLKNQLPFYKSFKGKHWHSLAFLLPIALNEMMDCSEIPWLQCFLLHVQYYRLLCKSSLTPEFVQLISDTIIAHHKLYVELYPSDFTSDKTQTDNVAEIIKQNKDASAFINFHLSQHWKLYIQLFGAPLYFSGESWEHSIKRLKKSQQNTNHHNPSNDVAKNYLFWIFGCYLQSPKIVQQQLAVEMVVKNKKLKSHSKVDPLTFQSLFHWNSLMLKGEPIRSRDVIQLKSGDYVQIRKVYANSTGEINTIQLSAFKCSPPVCVPNTGVSYQMQVLVEKQYINPEDVLSKVFYWRTRNQCINVDIEFNFLQ
jgi:hypothetical protein